MQHDGEHFVPIDQFLRGQHRFLRVVAVVLDDQLDLAAGNAAALVDLVHAHLQAVAPLLARARERAREVQN